MIKYMKLKLPMLVDLLARHTVAYTRMLADGLTNTKQFSRIERKILALQHAIYVKQTSLE